MSNFLEEAWERNAEFHDSGPVEPEEARYEEEQLENKKKKQEILKKEKGEDSLISSYFSIRDGIQKISDPVLKSDLEYFFRSMLTAAKDYSEAVADHVYANRKDDERDFEQEREQKGRTDHYRRQMHLGLVNSLKILCRNCNEAGIDTGNLNGILSGGEEEVRNKVRNWAMAVLDRISIN